jgi:hypothetical protein
VIQLLVLAVPTPERQFARRCPVPLDTCPFASIKPNSIGPRTGKELVLASRFLLRLVRRIRAIRHRFCRDRPTFSCSFRSTKPSKCRDDFMAHQHGQKTRFVIADRQNSPVNCDFSTGQAKCVLGRVGKKPKLSLTVVTSSDVANRWPKRFTNLDNRVFCKGVSADIFS